MPNDRKGFTLAQESQLREDIRELERVIDGVHCIASMDANENWFHYIFTLAKKPHINPYDGTRLPKNQVNDVYAMFIGTEFERRMQRVIQALREPYGVSWKEPFREVQARYHRTLLMLAAELNPEQQPILRDFKHHEQYPHVVYGVADCAKKVMMQEASPSPSPSHPEASLQSWARSSPPKPEAKKQRRSSPSVAAPDSFTFHPKGGQG